MERETPGSAPDPEATSPAGAPVPDPDPGDGERSGLLYCGLCGALNPASNHYCAACGTTLVDAFHGTEGLRIYAHPDAAARLVAIVPAGSSLEPLPDDDAPADFARVRLDDGRLGYVRLPEIDALASRANASASTRPVPNINTNARGCVSPGAALASLVLLIVTGTLILVLMWRSEGTGSGILTAVFCLLIVPFLLLTIGFYLYSRTREDRLAEEGE